MRRRIDDFTGTPLSNFHPSNIRMAGEDYPTVEHAYQALKAINRTDQKWIREAPTPSLAKKYGRKVTIRGDWHKMRVPLMTALLNQKFRPGTPEHEYLMSTGDAELVEGNWRGDTFWGVCAGEGENQLGNILMEIRDSFRKERKTNDSDNPIHNGR